jgi:hypothetical protein
MTQLPEPYIRKYDYSSYQNANPTPGIRVNVDLDDISRAIGEINSTLGVLALEGLISLSSTVET